ncbi:MAG: helix-turn-helix transcriptional regulator [Arcicella sp.]|nr:helix-turn-helix transcriptional regulator [Arcicella sp.]
MEQNKNLENFLNLVSNESSSWLEKAQWREDNKEWLDRSAKIAIKILSKLRNNRNEGKSPGSQVELAELMGVKPQQVNSIVKGVENLQLQTISRIEMALGIQLVEVCKTYEATTQVNINSKLFVNSISEEYIMTFPNENSDWLFASKFSENDLMNDKNAGNTPYAMAA